MFLSITTTHQPATDLGYLLHKHPERLYETALNFGTAWVFYPEAGPARCEAALLKRRVGSSTWMASSNGLAVS